MTKRTVAPRRPLILRLCLLAAAACVWPLGASQAQTSTATPSLREEFKDAFMIGAALNAAQFTERDTLGAALVKYHYNTVTPENVLKWGVVHPALGRYDFGPADQFVAFGEKHKMFIVGHTLVWHSQLPRWVHQDATGAPVSRDTLLSRMREHIMTVVGRYKGRIHGWDVVNEALEEDGTLRKTPFLQIIGEDYLVKAFQYAHEADPAAELYYNDYSLENPAKRAGTVALIKRLQAAGVPVKAVGVQGHHKMDWPSLAAEDSTITAFAALGVKVHFTELDVDVLPAAVRGQGADVATRARGTAAQNPYVAGLPDSVQRALAERYEGLFAIFMKHRAVIDRVTFWGVSDGDSWLNGWPVRGRTSHPLLFDRNHRPKPAFDGVVRAARTARKPAA